MFKTFKCHRLLNKYPMGMFQPTPFTWWKCLILLAVGMKSRPTLTVGRYICVFQYQFHVTLTEIENVTYTKTFCSRNLNAPADKSSAYQWRASGRRLISNYSFHSQFASQFHISCHLKIFIIGLHFYASCYMTWICLPCLYNVTSDVNTIIAWWF